MTDQEHPVRLTPLSSGNIERFAAASRSGNWDQEMEKGREARVRSLQLISELLIKNQRLTELLESVTNRKSPEFVREYKKSL